MLLGIFAHPDDELFAAALLARRAGEGEPVAVVVATRGEAGRSSIPTDLPLAELRLGELRASCDALGLPPPIALEFPDGAVASRSGALESELAEIIRDRAPDAIVTTGPDGVYGHRDHLAVTRAVEAVAACEVLYTAFPRGLFAPLRATLLEKVPGLAIDPDAELGVDPARVGLAIEVSARRDAKQRAIASHRSQLRGGGVFLSRAITGHMLAVEWYVRRAP